MKSKVIMGAVLLGALSVSLSSFASTYNGSCTAEPKEKWISQQDMQGRFEKQGYQVKKVKSTGSCYEVYAVDKNGKRTELFVNPATGAIVGEAAKS